MLKHLHIQNYSLIEQLDLHLTGGLTVITGETGAGKSILLGAISLLLGQRADSKSLFDASKKCIIEGQFSLVNFPHLQSVFEEEEIDFEEPCLIRREINPQGKSRSFVNDTPVTLETLKRIGNELVDIHSQQDTWWMSHPDFTLDMVDAYAQNEGLRKSYISAYSTWSSSISALRALEQESTKGTQELDFIQFQFDELSKAQLKEGEYEALDTAVQKLQNAEQIQEKLAVLAQALSISEVSALHQSRIALQQATALSKWGENFADWKTRIESIWIELKDLGAEVEGEAEDFVYDPLELEQKQIRLDLLNRMLQKYQVANVGELVALVESLDLRLSQFSSMDTLIADARERVDADFMILTSAAAALSSSRSAVLDTISTALVASLQSLGIPNANLAWEMTAKEVAANGSDKIQLLFSANKGLAPKPFKQIASGGEMSRLMLSIKHLLAKKRALPTLILDEIDTGVSGEIAIKMGQMLSQMSQGHQIIAITHLPQIAAAGSTHWFVYKDHAGTKTVSNLRELKEEERVEEIAKMIGGQQGYRDLLDNVRNLIQSHE
ncbi:DNA repair protein RecN [Aquirufa antheringensis]|jgi:DNA repair protein RecN (Recombination protein N)|uniref:DNA repair protein RecN n=1 Tax=Aquirufa antheringensis TaxID=2516559 RepID=A0A4Q9B9B3_9BACT|nr:DNA repair protein RecN [Aquirufa antheringensis]MCZ2485446.1 DNA repair protein RecN [Aquirufa antheringensis]MCZ2486849.1 DNA repair protein RecN [Aquirufa antheringensis]MCZ2488369.1 DNA repair protein RecN [Aquirufa antheringensis]TBH72070.1 DNA repair protein RecN [Aquirufa antheringensis]